jgi:hypothetical protein
MKRFALSLSLLLCTLAAIAQTPPPGFSKYATYAVQADGSFVPISLDNAKAMLTASGAGVAPPDATPPRGMYQAAVYGLMPDGVTFQPLQLDANGALIISGGGQGGGALFPITPGFVVNDTTTTAHTGGPKDFYNNMQYTQGEDLWGFGDSIMAADTQGPSSISKGFFAKLCSDYGGVCHNDAMGGTMSPQIATTVLGGFIVTDYNAPTRVMVEGGINDYINNGTALGAENNYKLSMQAGINWPGIAYNQKIMASRATQSGGSWIAAIGFFNAQNIAGVVGSWMEATTNGAALDFTVSAATVQTVGTSIGVLYRIDNSATPGTFTISIDGVLQTDLCSGTTTFTATGCNSVSTGTSLNPFEQIFPVTGATHDVHILSTSANPLYIGAVDVAPTSPMPTAPLVIVPGIPMQLADVDGTDSAAYNTIITTLATAMKARNINLLFVDLRGGNPGVNDTTDMGSNSLCGSIAPGNQHFNDCGSFHYAQTVENAAAFLGIPFTIPNTGGRSGVFTGPLSAPGNPQGNNTLQDWKPATSGVPGLTGFASGMEWTNNHNNFMMRTSEGLDSDGHFSLMNMIMGGFWGVYSCNTPFPTLASQCPALFTVDQGTGNVIEKFGNFSAPSITPGVLFLGVNFAKSMSGDSQALVSEADNGSIPIAPHHLLSWIPDTVGGTGSGAGDSGIDATLVCTSSNGKCAAAPTGNGFAVVVNGAFASAARTLVAADIPNLTQYQAAGNYFSFASGAVTANFIPKTISALGNQGNSSIADNGTDVITTEPFSAPAYNGPAVAPTGACTAGQWAFSKDGHASFCAAGTWGIKI